MGTVSRPVKRGIEISLVPKLAAVHVVLMDAGQRKNKKLTYGALVVTRRWQMFVVQDV